jgi:hypothetical protein
MDVGGPLSDQPPALLQRPERRSEPDTLAGPLRKAEPEAEYPVESIAG